MRAATKQLALVFVALVFLCVPVHSQCALSSDVVDGYWGGDVSTLVECFDAVPFDAEARDNIHDILMNTLDLYSFTDVARANIAPYYVNVDVKAELAALKTKSYTSLSGYLLDVLKIVNKLRDAHFEFRLPDPYNNAYILTPFCLNVYLDNGNLALKAAPPTALITNYQNLWGTSISSHFNKTITKINDEDAVEFVKTFADSIGRHKDEGIRFNELLGPYGMWCARSLGILPYDGPTQYTYTFSDDTTVTLPNKAISQRFNDSEQFVDAIYHPAAKKRAASDAETSDRRHNTKRIDETHSLPGSLEWIAGDDQIASWRLIVSGQEDAAVIKIKDFQSLTPDQTLGQLNNFAKILQAIGDAGYKNLILDLTNNIGGAVAMALNTLMWLTPEWEQGRLDSMTHPFPIADFRVTALADVLVENNDTRLVLIDYKTGNNIAVEEVYNANRRENISRGGSITSTMTDLFFLDLRPEMPGGIFQKWGASSGKGTLEKEWYFDRIIALTDGRCGSACAQFLTQLRHHDRIRVIFVGGLPLVNSDIASYPGGKVLSYDGLRNWLSDESKASFPASKTTASITFNFVETYRSCNSTVPRDFERMEADAYLRTWSIFEKDITSTDIEGWRNSYNVYASAAAYFPQMQAGLPLINRTRPADATDLCPSVERLSVGPAFSADCYGQWEDISECSKLCDTGEKTQEFRIYIPGAPTGQPCEYTHGTKRTVECNTIPCVDCVAEWRDTSVCRADCTKTRIYRQTTGFCPYANNTVQVEPCEDGLCVPSVPDGYRGTVVPVVHCVDSNAGAAYLGYINYNNFTVVLPQPDGIIADDSTKNIFTPAPANRGQPTTFYPGVQPYVLEIPVSIDSTTWTIDSSVSFSTINAIVQCPSYVSFGAYFESTNIPTNLDALKQTLSDDMGLGDTGRLQVTATAPYGTEGIWYLNITVAGPSVSSSISTGKALKNLADKIRQLKAGVVDYWIQLTNAGNVVVAPNFYPTIRSPTTLTPGSVINDQPPPEEFTEPSAATKMLVHTLVVLLAAMMCLLL